MTCENCDTVNYYPGKVIKFSDSNSEGITCTVCGEHLSFSSIQKANALNVSSKSPWDTYFHSICIAVASKSPCLSRKIGAILVKDHSIVSTGFNGPSRGIPHCGHDRVMKDDTLIEFAKHDLDNLHCLPLRWENKCPRQVLGYESGTHMELCPAQHAEENAISNAARLGVSVLGSILYMNSVIPCKNCFGTLINVGTVEIVVDKTEVYDKHTQYLIDNSNIKIRRFEE